MSGEMDWVMTAVVIVTAALVVFLIVVFIVLFRRFTINKENQPNPHLRETFAMPRGVFRGLLTLSVLVAVLVFQLAAFVLTQGKDHLQWLRMQEALDPLLVAFQMIIAFYFGGKIIGQLSDADTERSRNLAAHDPGDDLRHDLRDEHAFRIHDHNAVG